QFVEFATGSSAAGRAADALIPLAGGLGLGAASALGSEASALERTALSGGSSAALEDTSLSGLARAGEQSGLTNPGRVFPEFPERAAELATQAERLPAPTLEKTPELVNQAESLPPPAVEEPLPPSQPEKLAGPTAEQTPGPAGQAEKTMGGEPVVNVAPQ